MKIGILTYHRAYNYGAVLQCYALKEVTKRMGHDVYVIDYRQPDIERFYEYRRSFSLKKAFNKPLKESLSYLILTPLKDFKRLIIHYRFKKVFEKFQNKYLNVIGKCTSAIPDSFDCYIIGSDMLWAYDAKTSEFEPVYLGCFDHRSNSKIIGYAISGTPDSFKRLGEEKNYAFLDNFSSISIREKALAEIVRNYTNREISCCIDPTLLTTKELWESILKKKWLRKKYIVTYFLRVNDNTCIELNKKVKKLAKEKGLDIINIDGRMKSAPISVEDFVSIIGGAHYIVTDSFHGVIFSLIFERPFHALSLHDSHDARYVDILHTVGAGNLIVDTDYVPSIPDIDYKTLNKNVQSFREGSIRFLKSAI